MSCLWQWQKCCFYTTTHFKNYSIFKQTSKGILEVRFRRAPVQKRNRLQDANAKTSGKKWWTCNYTRLSGVSLSPTRGKNTVCLALFFLVTVYNFVFSTIILPNLLLLFVSFLTMRIMTAGHQKTGFPLAMKMAHLIENLFLQEPCCLKMMMFFQVKDQI